MAQQVVGKADGWSGIQKAVERAKPDEIVSIEPGDYEGSEPLRIAQKQITLRGNPAARLYYMGLGAAIELNDCQEVLIDGLMLMSKVDPSRPDEIPKLGEQAIGLINIAKSSHVSVRSCRIEVHDSARACIGANGSQHIQVSENVLVGGGCGIAFASSKGVIERNEASGGISGILLTPILRTPKDGSRAKILSNRCHSNREAGILIISSLGEQVDDNECWGNGKSGIVLQRQHGAGYPSSVATLTGNRCHSNREFGILVSSCEGAKVERNACWYNEDGGIGVLPSQEMQNIASTAQVLTNRCFANKGPGIIAFRSPRGEMRGNRCWGNEDDGILLLSATLAKVAHNECWGNGASGIGLRRDPRSKSQPAHSDVVGNLCHDNAGPGVTLHSSNGLIGGNECWANGSSGINLQRDSNSLSQRSTATIRENRCHDNAEAGIVLYSSKAPLIADNECWRNDKSGIALRRYPGPDQPPSFAQVERNRCVRNHWSIMFEGSTGSARSNEASGNEFDGVEFMPGGLAGLAPPEVADHRVGATIELSRLAGRELQQKLRGSDRPITEALTGFLNSGCVGCFQAYLRGSRIGSPEPTHGAERTPHRHLVLRKRAPARTGTERPFTINAPPADAPTAPALVRQILADQVRRTKPWADGSSLWIAYVASDEREVETLRDTLAQFAVEASPDSDTIIVAEPLMVDYTASNPRNNARRRFDLLEEELLAGRSRWAARFAAAARSPAFLVLALAVAAVVLVPAIPLRSWLRAQLVDDDPLGMAQILTLLTATASAAMILLFLVNRLLPSSLRFEPIHLLRAWRLVADFGLTQNIEKGLAKVGAKWPAAWEIRTWHKWVCRHLFGSGHRAATIVLTGVEQWAKGDIERLRHLSSNVPSGCLLTIVIHVDGRSLVSDLLLEDFAGQPWEYALHLVFADHVDQLTIASPAGSRTPPTLALLGAAGDNVGPFRDSLLDDRWSVLDMLPSLALGSAPGARFSIRDRKLLDFTQKRAELDAQAEVWRDIFGDGHPGYPPSEEAVATFQDFARAAPSVRVVRHVDARSRASDWFIGRVASRRAVADLMDSLWGEPAQAREYIASAIGCGLWKALKEVDAYLQPPSFQPESPVAGLVKRSLEAIRFLEEDLGRLVGRGLDPMREVHGRHHVEVLWDAIRLKVDALGTTERERGIYAAYLGAWHARALWRDPPEAARIIQRLAAAIDEIAATSQVAAELAPVEEALLRDITGKVLQLASMDPESGSKMFDRVQSLEWRGLPGILVDKLRETVRRLGAEHRGLGELLSRAGGATQVENLILLHATEPARVLYCLCAVACAQIGEDLEAEGARLIQLAAIGDVLARTWSALGPHVTALPSSDRLIEDLAVIASSEQTGSVLAFMTAGSTEPSLQELLWPCGKNEALEIEGILDLELDRFLRTTGEISRVWA
ncbi:MAG TPA: right-handed parallel beta-helix repeat-containing protein [Allosphingosinicella sp.]|nr:right-handed parallel beta-helix repeat-containing protein [Allosphingosinicella sp.]